MRYICKVAVDIENDVALIDIGYKSEGMILVDQFSSEELATLAVNDPVQVYIEQCEDADGNLMLSKEKADKMKVWEDLEVAHKEETQVQGKVISRIKGGMIVAAPMSASIALSAPGSSTKISLSMITSR